MSIERVERFVTMGKEFDSVDEAIGYREDLIAAFIAKLPGYHNLRGEDRIPFIAALIEGRKELRRLLDYEYPGQ